MRGVEREAASFPRGSIRDSEARLIHPRPGKMRPAGSPLFFRGTARPCLTAHCCSSPKTLPEGAGRARTGREQGGAHRLLFCDESQPARNNIPSSGLTKGVSTSMSFPWLVLGEKEQVDVLSVGHNHLKVYNPPTSLLVRRDMPCLLFLPVPTRRIGLSGTTGLGVCLTRQLCHVDRESTSSQLSLCVCVADARIKRSRG